MAMPVLQFTTQVTNASEHNLKFPFSCRDFLIGLVKVNQKNRTTHIWWFPLDFPEEKNMVYSRFSQRKNMVSSRFS